MNGSEAGVSGDETQVLNPGSKSVQITQVAYRRLRLEKSGYVCFGEKEWPRPDGEYLFLTACVDLRTRPPIGRMLDEVATEFDRLDREGAPRFDERMVNSVVVLGYEFGAAPLTALHEAYNAMWARNPGLWLRIQERTFPTTFWLVDGEQRPFFGIIQPSMEFEFELWSARDVRESELYQQYLTGGPSRDFRWQTAIVPIQPQELAEMIAYIHSKR